jgi:hypothetical protein
VRVSARGKHPQVSAYRRGRNCGTRCVCRWLRRCPVSSNTLLAGVPTVSALGRHVDSSSSPGVELSWSTFHVVHLPRRRHSLLVSSSVLHGVPHYRPHPRLPPLLPCCRPPSASSSIVRITASLFNVRVILHWPCCLPSSVPFRIRVVPCRCPRCWCQCRHSSHLPYRPLSRSLCIIPARAECRPRACPSDGALWLSFASSGHLGHS